MQDLEVSKIIMVHAFLFATRISGYLNSND